MKVRVSFASSVLVVAKTLEEALDIVTNQDFDWGDASMPTVLDADVEDDDEGNDEPPEKEYEPDEEPDL